MWLWAMVIMKNVAPPKQVPMPITTTKWVNITLQGYT